MKVLIAVDGSKHALDAVKCLIDHAGWYRSKPEVVLLTVHLPVPKLPRMGYVVGKNQIERYYREEGEACLAAARRRLRAAGIKHKALVRVGPIAETIVKCAQDTRCDILYIATRGMTGIGRALIGSTAAKVLNLATTPVLLVR